MPTNVNSRNAPRCRVRSAAQFRSGEGFTLVELVVVLALLAVLSGVGWAAWRRPQTPAREAAIALVQAGLNAARGEAALGGGDAALLVSSAPDRPDDFLRRFVRVRSVSGAWEPDDRGQLLPLGIYFVPPDGLGLAAPGTTGAIVDRPENWTDADGDPVRSTALRAWPSTAPEILGSRAWWMVRFSPQGTSAGGDLWIGAGRPLPGVDATVHFENPEAVTGLVVSRYGAVSELPGRIDR